MTHKHEDWSLKVQNWQSHISANQREDRDGEKYVEHWGHVATPYGYVIVSADASKLPYTALSFIWQDRVYHRSYKKYFRSTHIITLAKRFAVDIAQPAPSAEDGNDVR